MTPEDLIARGWYIFPCNQNKNPVPGMMWQEQSSISPLRIEYWKQIYPGCLWGLDAEKSHLFIIDDDRGKKPAAIQTYFELELNYGFPTTFTARSRSGGFHYYHDGIGAGGTDKLGPGLDVKSAGGYVIAPCSEGYSVELDAPMAPAPQWALTLAGILKAREHVDRAPLVELDKESSIALALSHLRLEAPAVEKSGGDLQTLRVACRVMDKGVSPETTLNLMLEEWNDTCQPPWSAEDLWVKVQNAEKYRNSPIGFSSPEAVFTSWEDPGFPTQMEKKSLFIDANELISRTLSINYLVEDLIETPATGLMFGASTAGKSFLAISLAYGVATGTVWLGRASKRGPVFYLAGEGQNGIPRRLKAWTKYYNQTSDTGMLNISRSRVELTEAAAKEMRLEIDVMALKYGPPALIIIDTLARHIPADADENSAKDVGAFINVVDNLKNCYRCVILLIHHSGKQAQDTSRGSSALKAAMDFEILVKKGALEYTKQKDGELPRGIGFILQDVELETEPKIMKSAVPIVCEYDPTGGKLANLSSDAKLAYSILQFMLSSGNRTSVPEKEWRKEFYEALGEEWKATTKMKKFSRSAKMLTENATIRYTGDLVKDNSLSEVSNED